MHKCVHIDKRWRASISAASRNRYFGYEVETTFLGARAGQLPHVDNPISNRKKDITRKTV